jgi:hypothetical protein
VQSGRSSAGRACIRAAALLERKECPTIQASIYGLCTSLVKVHDLRWVLRLWKINFQTPGLLSTLFTDIFVKHLQLDAPRTTGMHSVPVSKFPGTVKPPISSIPFLVPTPRILLAFTALEIVCSTSLPAAPSCGAKRRCA